MPSTCCGRSPPGIVVGLLVGQALGWLIFHYAEHARLPESGDGLVALGITLVAYGLTELAHGYGFLAVFVAALTLRRWERYHHYHTRLHDFAEQIERLLMMFLLVLFGGARRRRAVRAADLGRRPGRAGACSSCGRSPA